MRFCAKNCFLVALSFLVARSGCSNGADRVTLSRLVDPKKVQVVKRPETKAKDILLALLFPRFNILINNNSLGSKVGAVIGALSSTPFVALDLTFFATVVLGIYSLYHPEFLMRKWTQLQARMQEDLPGFLLNFNDRLKGSTAKFVFTSENLLELSELIGNLRESGYDLDKVQIGAVLSALQDHRFAINYFVVKYEESGEIKYGGIKGGEMKYDIGIADGFDLLSGETHIFWMRGTEFTKKGSELEEIPMN
ncbi:MAG: hypothetical protein LBK29_01795 [Oscillospiraceae bacterium]|jgi:hypothetical protein|nr:hypothetical protein [Oscillospiraceae bacterium]